LLRAEEERMKRDREAQWLARVMGWACSIKGGSLCDKQKSVPIQLAGGRLQPGLTLGDVPLRFGLDREQNWYYSVLKISSLLLLLL
jgi:hypothetical protein